MKNVIHFPFQNIYQHLSPTPHPLNSDEIQSSAEGKPTPTAALGRHSSPGTSI